MAGKSGLIFGVRPSTHFVSVAPGIPALFTANSSLSGVHHMANETLSKGYEPADVERAVA